MHTRCSVRGSSSWHSHRKNVHRDARQSPGSPSCAGHRWLSATSTATPNRPISITPEYFSAWRSSPPTPHCPCDQVSKPPLTGWDRSRSVPPEPFPEMLHHEEVHAPFTWVGPLNRRRGPFWTLPQCSAREAGPTARAIHEWVARAGATIDRSGECQRRRRRPLPSGPLKISNPHGVQPWPLNQSTPSISSCLEQRET